MAEKTVVKHSELVEAAANLAITTLNELYNNANKINWVLAGGRVQIEVYEFIASNLIDKIDWSKLRLILGDERCVPLKDKQSNWQQISEVLLDKVATEKLRPKYELTPSEAAADYGARLEELAGSDGIPEIEYLWLGIGEDGHTLSLFPNHEAAIKADELVMPVYDAPKQPPERITLTPKALGRVKRCLIVLSGEAKSEATQRAFDGDKSLPVTVVVEAIEKSGGQVKWLMDEVAASKL